LIYQLPKAHVFPHPALASDDGLLAVGGDLNPHRVLLAYRSGIFPWYSDYEPILWWSPNPRFVLFPNDLKIAKSMRPILRKTNYSVTINQQFEAVISHCKTVDRRNQGGTWITEEMKATYLSLHHLGYAHSVEVWDEAGTLTGGLYGIALGKLFCGESMFAKTSNASKIAFIHFVQFLKQHQFELIDCQNETDHLARFGAKHIDRLEFLKYVKQNSIAHSPISNWSTDFKNYFEETRTSN